MDIRIRTGNALQDSSELAAIGVFEGQPLPDAIAGLLEPRDFRGKSEETLLLYPRDAVSPRRLLLIGLGKSEAITAETMRRAGAIALRQARALQVASPTIALPSTSKINVQDAAQALVEGIVLGGYRYWRFRTGLSDEQLFAVADVTIFVADADVDAATEGSRIGEVIGAAVLDARELVNSPGGILTPADLAEHAVEVGERLDMNVTVLDENELLAGGYGGIMGVGQGSDAPPRFIIMEYGSPAEGIPTICLVGKGITFDSGGLSLKPGDAMETMKCDMGGSAAVIGAMQAVAGLQLPLHVVGLIASAENMPSSKAFRPGDILTTLSGKTIEVLNTDAEGRIVLADALFYAQRYNPAAIVEFSTLTGAVIVALGSHAIGMMATDQALADRISVAGSESGERVWQLPLWQEYFDMIKSEYADVKNIGGRAAGSITAGAFLANFTGDFPFVHLDIAGTAFADKASKPYDAPGATGVGVRLVTQFLRDYKA